MEQGEHSIGGQAWARRIITALAILAAMGISRISHSHPEWIHRGTASFSVLNWLYGLSLLFLLLGAPVWLLLGSAGDVAEPAERNALRSDVVFVLGSFLLVLFLVLIFTTRL